MNYTKIRFSHPTKTGGSSVEQVLKTVYPDIKHNHKPLCTLLQSREQGIEFSFTTVRNPYDRVMDMYNYFKEKGDAFKAKKLAEGVIIKRQVFSEKFSSFDDFLDKLVAGELHSRWYTPQHYYVEYKGYKVDEIIRIESFQEDWDRVIKGKLGLDIDMIHANPTTVKEITSLTDIQKDKIYKYYEKDFLLLGYEK